MMLIINYVQKKKCKMIMNLSESETSPVSWKYCLFLCPRAVDGLQRLNVKCTQFNITVKQGLNNMNMHG